MPDKLKKGEAILVQVEAFITSPMADITFTANQPLGYDVSKSVKIVSPEMTVLCYAIGCVPLWGNYLLSWR